MRYAFLLFFAASSLWSADQIAMKNGDRITGTIVKSDYAGDLTIKWEAVGGVTSAQPLNIGLKDGKTVVRHRDHARG